MLSVEVYLNDIAQCKKIVIAKRQNSNIKGYCTYNASRVSETLPVCEKKTCS